ncbi:LAGLIDADG family homing endonuclease [Clostridium sp. BSD9I1]|uniref:LAGLIDADG family homing endonuclease n=1 Tax=Clostridium sp. BSD9I1 TaxID=2003589 RepID=UPI001647FE68|nr:LAGLIDADG family homing endonuclease [Clostridium sp. BSD9I1]
MKRFELDNYKVDIINLYQNQGLSCDKIAKAYGASLCGIYDALRRWKVPTRNLSKSHKVYKINDSFFKKIDTEDKAYWLGFIYADGFITMPHSFGLSLAAKDKSHLVKLLKCLESNYPLHDYETDGKYGKHPYSRLLINNEEIFRDLQDKNVRLRKTLIIEFPNEEVLPKELYKHFIRGYFDGDGSLILSEGSINFKICGTKEFLFKFIQIFNEVSKYDFKYKLYKRNKDNKNNYYLSYGGLRKVYSILSYLYKDSTIFLDRKKEKYKKLEEIFYS